MAIGVARRWEGCMIHICYISQVPVSAQLGAMAVPISPLAGGGQGAELKQAISEELARSGVVGKFYERSGDVARELEAVAEACHADLIAVGRSRHPALHLGGVPRRLLAMGHRPVVVVP